jgi:putative transposase
MLGLLHQKTAKWVNRLDGLPGRTVWHNYRETLLTYQKSYLARLNYVHQNAVKHGLVAVANGYPWCSAAWFERTASPAMVKSIYRFKTEKVSVPDDFEPDGDW